MFGETPSCFLLLPASERDSGAVSFDAEVAYERIKYSNPESSFDQRLERVKYDIRSSPNESTGCTPFSLLMNRNMRTTLPSLSSSSAPTMPKRDLEKKYSQKQVRRPKTYSVGDPVYVKKGNRWGESVVVVDRKGHSTYLIKYSNGRLATFNKFNMKPRYDDDTECLLDAFERQLRVSEEDSSGDGVLGSRGSSRQDERSAEAAVHANAEDEEIRRPLPASVDRRSNTPRGRLTGSGPYVPRRGSRRRQQPVWLKDFVSQ